MLVGGKLVLYDLVIIEKQEPDGKLKHRVILNCLSSGGLKSSMKTEKAVLPRVMVRRNPVVSRTRMLTWSFG